MRPSLASFPGLVAALAVSLVPLVAHADTGFAIDRFEPAERGSAWLVQDSLDLRGHVRPAFGLVLGYQRRPLAIREEDGTLRAAVVDHLASARLGGNVVLWERVRAGLDVPIVLAASGTSAAVRGALVPAPSASQALGDPRLAVDVRLLGQHGAPLTVAAGAAVWLPLGASASYAGDGALRVSPRVLAAGSVGAFAWAARLGAVLRDPATSDVGGTPIGSDLVYGASAGLRVAEGRVLVGPELFGSTTLSEATFAKRTSPLEALLAASGDVVGGLRASAGVGAGLASGVGSPAYRVVLGLTWSPPVVVDADGDGILDAEDRCPLVRGIARTPASDPRQENGCPLPPALVDTDGDGIPDQEDACMDAQGPRTKDPRTNGCGDRDQDGIPDPLDACPGEAGPVSTDPKKTGCPDADGDGILDRDDTCPRAPGPPNANPKFHGCPGTADADGDGVPNDEDACPELAGKPNTRKDRNGCPRAVLTDGRVRIYDQPQFAGDRSPELASDPVTQESLEALRAMLEGNPGLRMRIEAHTDAKGKPAELQKLSDARAAAVVAWITARGIDAARVSGRGFGGQRPIDVNTTDEGRRANNRIEVVVEKSPVP